MMMGQSIAGLLIGMSLSMSLLYGVGWVLSISKYLIIIEIEIDSTLVNL